MARKRKNDKELKKLNRYFMVAKTLLMITPVICYLYILLKATYNNVSFQEAFSQDPSIVVMFLVAMINPYIAYIVKLLQAKLDEGNYKFALINMVILLTSQALTLNGFYFMMLLFVFYRAIRYYHIQVLPNLKTTTFKQTLFDGGGSLFVMLVSSISLFATIRLM